MPSGDCAGRHATLAVAIGWWRRPDRFFLVASLVSGLGYAALVPPFQNPDEPVHFYRAFAITEGQLGLRPVDGGLGARVPASLPRAVAAFSSGRGFPTGRTVSFGLVRAHLGRHLRPTERVAVAFPNSGLYPFVPYLPQAAALRLARAVDASPLAAFYSARVAVLGLTTALVWLAIRILPFQRWLVVALALTPMAASLRASVGIDALTTALAFLLTALVARRHWGPADEVDSWRADLLLGATAIGLLLTKLPYAPLALLLLLVPRRRRSRFAPLLLLAALAAFAYTAALPSTLDQIRPGDGVDADAQIRRALHHPLDVGAVLAADLWVHAPRYAAQAVGVQLAWLEARLPTWLAIAYLVALGLIVTTSEEAATAPPQRTGDRFSLLAIILAAAGLVAFSQYVVFTPYAARHVEGVQGRYFLPLLPALGLALRHRREPLDERTVRAISILTVTTATLVAWWCLGAYYWD